MARIVNIVCDDWEERKKYLSDRLEQLNISIFGYSTTESSETAGVIWILKLGLFDDYCPNKRMKFLKQVYLTLS